MTTRRLILLSALAASGGACHHRLSTGEHRIEAAVRNYNLALPRAYATKSSDLLASFATDDEVDRVGLVIQGLSSSDMVLDARQEAFRTGSVRVPAPGKAELSAAETWWYRRVSPRTGRVGQPPRRVEYRIVYHLVEIGDGWRVARVDEREAHVLPGSA